MGRGGEGGRGGDGELVVWAFVLLAAGEDDGHDFEEEELGLEE